MRKQYDFSKAKRGAVVAGLNNKVRITIRLDHACLLYTLDAAHETRGLEDGV